MEKVIVGPTWETPAAAQLGLKLFAATGLVAVLGQALSNLSLAWRIATVAGLGRLLFPDLSGKWIGEVVSHGGRTGDCAAPTVTPISMQIDQRWSRIAVKVSSASGYSSTRAIHVIPAHEEGEDTLSMIYQGVTPQPLETDEQSYFGASRLVYDPESGTLNGFYWTNRAHFRDGGRNTAGIIKLRRSAN